MVTFSLRPLLLVGFSIATCLAQEGGLDLVRPLPDTATLEDVPLRLWIRGTFRDSQDSPVTYAAKVMPGTGSVAIVGDSLAYTPPVDWHGTAEITLFGETGLGADFTRFFVETRAVNDAPAFDGSWGMQSFHNNDSIRIDFTGKVRDVETPHSLSLRVDSIPGCLIRTEGLSLTLRAPGRIDDGELRLRLADPEGGLSPYLAIPFSPNSPARGDTVPLTARSSPATISQTRIHSLPVPGFSVVTTDTFGITLDTYRPDGSKFHASRHGRFPGLKPTQPPRIIPVGGNYLAEIFHHPPGAGSMQSAICLFDAGMQVVNTLEPAVSAHLWVVGADTVNRRFYVRNTVFQPGGPNLVTLEAYDSELQPLPEPAFAAAFLQDPRASLRFEAGRTLVLVPRNRILPLEIGVEAYSVDGRRLDSSVLRLDHAPSEEGLTPDLTGYLLEPYRGGYCLFAGIQDILLSPAGGHSAAWKDYRTIRQKFDATFQPTGKAQAWERDPSDALYPLTAFPLAGGHLLVSAAQDHSFRREHRQYLHRFDGEMEPVSHGDLRIRSADVFTVPSEFAQVTPGGFAELLQYTDGRQAVVMHGAGPGPARLAPRTPLNRSQAHRKGVLRVRGRGGYDVSGRIHRGGP